MKAEITTDEVIEMIERLRSVIVAEFSTNGEDQSVKRYQAEVDMARSAVDRLRKETQC